MWPPWAVITLSKFKQMFFLTVDQSDISDWMNFGQFLLKHLQLKLLEFLTRTYPNKVLLQHTNGLLSICFCVWAHRFTAWSIFFQASVYIQKPWHCHVEFAGTVKDGKPHWSRDCRTVSNLDASTNELHSRRWSSYAWMHCLDSCVTQNLSEIPKISSVYKKQKKPSSNRLGSL